MSVFTKILESWNSSCEYLKGLIDKTESKVSKNNTQISDIYNRTGGGKNLINPSKLTYKNCTYTENTDEHSYTITNTGTWSQFYNYVNCKKEKEYILSFTVSNITGDTSINDVYIINNSNNANLGWIGIRADGTYSKKFKAITDGMVRIGLCPNDSGTNRELTFTISEIMVRPAEIKEPTYVPYIPTNAELESSLSSIQDFLKVKTYDQSCFVKDGSKTDIVTRSGMTLKESGYAWVFDLYITYIHGVEANTKTKLGTVTPAPPRKLCKRNVTIMKNDNSGVITNDAIIDITKDGSLYITSPVAIKPSDTGIEGRIYSAGECVFEAIKL